MMNIEKLRFFTNETSMPYSENENPFLRTEEDDKFDEMIIEEYHLVTKEKETLLLK
jgi:hypothetical protein